MAVVVIMAAKEEVRRCTVKTEKVHIGRRSRTDGRVRQAQDFHPVSVQLSKDASHTLLQFCT